MWRDFFDCEEHPQLRTITDERQSNSAVDRQGRNVRASEVVASTLGVRGKSEWLLRFFIFLSFRSF